MGSLVDAYAASQDLEQERGTQMRKIEVETLFIQKMSILLEVKILQKKPLIWSGETDPS